jgi:glycosyltransferase involved in cell wall biosynthesis
MAGKRVNVRNDTIDVRGQLVSHPGMSGERGGGKVGMPRRILLAERACAERHPPVLHQAAILERLGTVSVLDAPGWQDNHGMQTSPSVKRIRVSAANNSVKGPAIANAKWALRYAREFRRQFAVIPDVVVAYEPDASALLLMERVKNGGPMRIVHLHETPDKLLYADSITSKIAIRYMLARLNDADLVILPDEDRAAYTMETARLRRPPAVVMNCPPILDRLPASRLLPWLLERGISVSRIVHFHGAIGAERGLAKVIASMRYWPTDAVFVIVGDGSSTVKQQLLELATQEGVSSRVLFVGRVPYDDVLSFAAGASLGVTLVEPLNRNTEFCAGASNKRFEYAALGMPQVTNAGAGMRGLFEAPGIAMLADIGDVESIGTTVAHLLQNPSVALAIGERARRLHLSRYNYEVQFAPVVERMEEWMLTRGMKRV